MFAQFLSIKSGKQRVFGLDILRAIAIFSVVYGHGTSFLQGLLPRDIIDYPKLDGVSLFFVLSGYLIGRILIKTIDTRGSSFPVLFNFWIRRWFRTLPNYFLILIVLLVFHSLIFGLVPLSHGRYFVFLQNFNTPHPSFFGVAWSLSVEEWFYILLPLGLFGAIKMGVEQKRALLGVALLLFILPMLIRYYRFSTIDITNYLEYGNIYRNQVITRLDSLMYGVLGAYLSYFHPKAWVRYKKLLFIAGLLLIMLYRYWFQTKSGGSVDFDFYRCVLSFSHFSLATMLLLPFLSTLNSGKGKLYQIITGLSLISYSMYLIHYGIIKEIALPLTTKFIPIHSPLLLYFLYWAYSIIGSILLYKYFEKPMTNLRNQYSVEKIKSWFHK